MKNLKLTKIYATSETIKTRKETIESEKKMRQFLTNYMLSVCTCIIVHYATKLHCVNQMDTSCYIL